MSSHLTQDGDVCVGFLRRICVELAHVASLVGERYVGQRHPEFVVREIHQLEPAVLESCRGYRVQGHKCEMRGVRREKKGGRGKKRGRDEGDEG